MPGIELYRHFGLSASPFDGRPDPRFYYATAAHAETLATLQYAVRTRRPCTLVLGDSGSGKTLLGRLLAQSLAGQTGIAWIHGIGQPDNRTDVTLCPANRLARADPFGPTNTREVALGEWLRVDPSAAQAGVVIVDNADGLRPHNWDDILSLVTREIRSPRTVALILFGLPGLVETLAGPSLVRLQRRVFRACRLSPLSRADVDGYVRHRLRVAALGAPRRPAGTAAGEEPGRYSAGAGPAHVGAAGTAPGCPNADAGPGNVAPEEIFTPAALDLVHRFSDGNPALLNQLCDNALVDAFADDRTEIDGRHIVATIHAITGGIRSRRYLPSPPTGAESPFAATRMAGGIAGPMVTAACRAESRLRRWSSEQARPAVDLGDFIGEPRRWDADHPLPRVHTTEEPQRDDSGISGAAPTTGVPGADATTSQEPIAAGTTAQPAAPDGAPAPPLDQRLRALEGRLAEALARVREARRRPYILPPPPRGQTPWPELSPVEPVAMPVVPDDPLP